MTQPALKNIQDLIQKNEGLIEEIRDGIKSLIALNDKLDQHRNEATVLLDQINALAFAPARDTDVRELQQELLKRIEQLSKDISTFADKPDLLILLFAQQGELWFALGNTFNAAAGSIITFSAQEIDDLRVLLRRATLDTQARQRAADVLDAAVQISKFGFRIAQKVVA